MTRREPVDQAPLVVHVVFRFDYGGLENGVVNLVNSMTDDSLRHIVVALTEVTKFADRLAENVPAIALGKKPGKDFLAYFRLYRLLCKLRPTIVHTRNIGTLDCAFIAFLARVPIRIHGEHGWDVFDPDGSNKKYQRIRRIFGHFVHHFVAVSSDLKDWLIDVVGIPAPKVTHICNGVDTNRFRPGRLTGGHEWPDWLADVEHIVIGTVSRFSTIKDPTNLVEAFIQICRKVEGLRENTRLVMIGDGELRYMALSRLEEEGLAKLAWLPGSRDDVAKLLRCMDVFVLASYREGISNTILEAMATGLPVVATATGGNLELIQNGSTGQLVPTGDSAALASAVCRYLSDRSLRKKHGRASRDRVLNNFSMQLMMKRYLAVYQRYLVERVL